MKLTPRRFTVEEFGEQSSWIGALLSPLNQVVQELFSGLTNNVTIADNLYQEIKESKFLVDSGTYPIKFKTKFPKFPIGLTVIYCKDTLDGTASSSPFVSWSFDNGLLSITNITGLTASRTYIIRILIIYG